jgi:hypothetical protein
VQKVGGKEEGHSIFLDQHHHHHFSSPSNHLLMFLQSTNSQMHGGLYPSLDVALSNLSPPLGSSPEFVAGGANKQPSSLGLNLLFRSLCCYFIYAALSMTWVQVLWLCCVCEAYFAKTRLGIVTPTFSACTVFLKLLGVANRTAAISMRRWCRERVMFLKVMGVRFLQMDTLAPLLSLANVGANAEYMLIFWMWHFW